MGAGAAMNHWTRACHKHVARIALGGMFCAVSVAAAAAAAEYHQVSRSGNYIMLVDKSSIYQAGDYTRASVVTMSADPNEYPILSTLDEVDCAQRRWRTLSHTSRDDNGDVVNSVDDNDPSWNEVKPDTLGEDVVAAICSPSSMTDEALWTDNLADILEAYLDSLDDQ